MRYTPPIGKSMSQIRNSGRGLGRAFQPVFYWSALALILWPIGLDLRDHLLSNRFDHYIAVAVVLFLIQILTGSRRPEASDPEDRAHASDRLGIVLLGLALALGILGYTIEAGTLSRVSAVLAVIGMGRFLGQFSWETGALLLLAVPIPAFIANWTTPVLESLYLGAVAPLLSALGAHIELSGQVLQIDGQRLELFPEDSGLRLAWVGAAIGWFHGLRSTSARNPKRFAKLRSALGPAIGFALLGFSLQLPGVLLAGLIVWLGGEEIGRLWVGSGLWIVFAGVTGAWVLSRQPDGSS
jgi:hypothetical protein